MRHPRARWTRPRNDQRSDGPARQWSSKLNAGSDLDVGALRELALLVSRFPRVRLQCRDPSRGWRRERTREDELEAVSAPQVVLQPIQVMELAETRNAVRVRWLMSPEVLDLTSVHSQITTSWAR